MQLNDNKDSHLPEPLIMELLHKLKSLALLRALCEEYARGRLPSVELPLLDVLRIGRARLYQLVLPTCFSAKLLALTCEHGFLTSVQPCHGHSYAVIF